jgi:uncharacterized protein DUF3592
VDDTSLFEVAFSWILAAIVLFSVAGSVRYFFRKWSSANWPITDATVQKGQIGRGGPSKYAVLVYRSVFGYVYSVNGTRYAGLFVIIVGSEEKASELQRRLDGVRVRVRYNVSHPETSIMQSLPGEFASFVANQDPMWVNYGGELIGLNL